MRSVRIVFFASVAVFIAKANLISETGQVSVIAPPPDVRVNIGLESNTVTSTFTERLGSVLLSPIAVDISAPGTYSSVAGLTPGIIAAGTAVDSYYLHTDPVGSSTTLFSYAGSVTFNTNILGVIVLDAQFASSNGVLGHPGTLYSASGQGLELGSPDTVTLSATGKTLSYSVGTNTAADDIRIITASSAPEPSTGILVLICVVGLAVFRKRIVFRNI